jgi:hydroxyacylglutathione hydrolase
MVNSLAKFTALPDQTQVFCAHEYTQSNGRFALSVEPKNKALVDRMAEVDQLRKAGKPTVPSTIAIEKATNPFLRPSSAELQKMVGLVGADLVEVFAETRKLKDDF